MPDVGANYRYIVDRISAAAASKGRDIRTIKLLAAAKAQSSESIRDAIAAGVRLVGENYVQEAELKKQQVSGPVEWHMIGHLQRNKAKVAVEVFDVIESLDNVPLARELDKEAKKHNKIVRTLVEVNLAGEANKTGIAKAQVASLLEEIGKLSYVYAEGLMTVPPLRENFEEVRPYFRELRELQIKLRERSIPHVDLRELSMGMTHDYAVAVEEGATIVRIGTALFGPRQS
jgi:pyridoxal phosphate enzyme (YggS family)